MDPRRNPFPLLRKESSLSMNINKESGVVKSLKDGVFFLCLEKWFLRKESEK